ncbi:MAG: DUF2341 domain-containing protein, partial [archaeon]
MSSNLERERREILKKIELCNEQKEKVIDASKELKNDFGKLDFFEYQIKQNKIFRDKTPEQWISYYSLEIRTLKAKLEWCERELREQRRESVPVKKVKKPVRGDTFFDVREKDGEDDIQTKLRSIVDSNYKKSEKKRKTLGFVVLFVILGLVIRVVLYSFVFNLDITGLVVEGEDDGGEDEVPSEPEPEPAEEVPAEEAPVEEEVVEEEPEEEVEEEVPEEEDPVEEVVEEEVGEEPEEEVIDENVTEEEVPEENVTLPEEEEEPEINVTIPETNETEEPGVVVPEVNETLPEENVTEEEIIIPEVNVTIPEVNVTETNVTIISNVSGVNASTLQYAAIINRPTKWIKQVDIEEWNGLDNLTLDLPLEAFNISIKTGGEVQDALDELEDYGDMIENADREDLVSGIITGNVVSDIGKGTGIITKFWKWISGFTITGNVVKEEKLKDKIKEKKNKKEVDLTEVVNETQATEIAVEYYTLGPSAIESEIGNGKRVVVSGDDELNYTEVLAYAEIPEMYSVGEEGKIKIYWREQGIYVNFTALDLDGNGGLDYVEWVVPHLSNQTFDIILIIKAEHLDSNRSFISDIYDSVKELDGNWSEEIPEEDYVRVTFEQELDFSKDITIYPRIVSGEPRVEVYEVDGIEKIAEFIDIQEGENKVYLSGLNGTQDSFDLRVVDGSVEFDWIVDPPQNTWNSSFTRCQNITIVSAGTTTLTDFPAYINLTYDPDMQADFEDIRFINTSCDNGGSLLDYEIENYTGANAHVWVRIPSLPSAGTTISVYYGNADANNAENPPGVWDANYMGVWHISEGTGTFVEDSTGKYNGTLAQSDHWNTTGGGKVGNAYSFDGVDDNVNIGDIDLTTAATLEAWAYPTSIADNYRIIAKAADPDHQAPWVVYDLEIQTGFYYRMKATTGSVDYATSNPGGNYLSTNEWRYLFGTYDGSTAYYYEDAGVGRGSTSSPEGSLDTNNRPTYIGFNEDYANQHFIGVLDEIRISNIARSVDWMNQTYQMVVNQGSYVIFDTEEDMDVGVPGVTVNSPANGSVLFSSTVEFNVTTDENVTATWFTIDGGATNYTMTNNGNRDFNYTLTGITNDTYTTKFYANDTNGNLNDSETSIFIIPSCNVPASGNWDVNGDEFCENQAITITDDVNVNNGGTLVWRNVSFTYNLGANGEEIFSVLSGGNFSVYNGSFHETGSNHYYYIRNYGDMYFKDVLIPLDEPRIYVYDTGETHIKDSQVYYIYQTNDDSQTHLIDSSLARYYIYFTNNVDVAVEGLDQDSASINVTISSSTSDYLINFSNVDFSTTSGIYLENNGGTLTVNNSNIYYLYHYPQTNDNTVFENTFVDEIYYYQIVGASEVEISNIGASYTKDAANNFTKSISRTDSHNELNFSNVDFTNFYTYARGTNEGNRAITRIDNCTLRYIYSHNYANVTASNTTANRIYNYGTNTRGIYEEVIVTGILYAYGSSVNNFIRVNVTGTQSLFYETSQSTLEQCDLGSTTDTRIYDTAILNFTQPSSVIDDLNLIGAAENPTIYGHFEIDGVDAWAVGNTLNRYFPFNVTLSAGGPAEDKNVTIYDGASVLNSGLTGADGFIVLNISTDNNENWYKNYSIYIGEVYYQNITMLSSTAPSGINLTIVADEEYPIFSNYQDVPANNTAYSFGVIYRFNSSVVSTNGTVGLEFNGINYTALNLTASVFNSSVVDLAAGTYGYYWFGWGNGTDENYNVSGTRYYTVAKAVPGGSLTNTDAWTVIYPEEVTIGLSESNAGDGDVTYLVYRDNVSKSTGETVTLGAGVYEYLLNTTGGQNWTANSTMDIETLTINQGAGVVDLYVNHTENNISIQPGESLWLNATLTTGDTGNLYLYHNGTLINNGTSPVSNLTTFAIAGMYNVSAYYVGSVNYTANWSTSYWVNVSDIIAPDISFASSTPGNGTTTMNTSIEINVSIVDSDLEEVIYNWNGTNFTLYDNDLILMFNFDNLSALGESNSLYKDVSPIDSEATCEQGLFCPKEGVPGVYGNAAQFWFQGTAGSPCSGYDCGPRLPYDSRYVISDTTFAGWVYFNNTVPTDDYIIMMFGNGNIGGTVSYWNIFVTNDNSGHIGELAYQCNQDGGGSAQHYSASNFNSTYGNKWTHVVVAKNDTNVRIYFDGKLDSDQATNALCVGPTNLRYEDVGAIHIGRDPNKSTEGWHGYMDELRVWNRSLTEEEVIQDYMLNLYKYNSTQWYLYVNQTQNATTGLSVGDYTYRAFASDGSGNLNMTEERTVSIIQDNEYPVFSNYWDNNDSLTGSGVALFNVTVTSTNGTVFLEINGTNYTATNVTADVYNVSVDLINGTYSYYWGSWGNGTDTNYNVSGIRYYTVNAVPVLGLELIYPTGNVNVTQNEFFNVTLNVSCLLGSCGEINITLDPSVNWWNGSWNRRQEINISNAGTSALTDFPAYINLTYDPDMQADFDDLRFVNGSCGSGETLELSYEVEGYTGNNAHVWVGIPSIKASGVTPICMYYGNTDANNAENPPGVWDANYMGVWHISEGTGTFV